MCWSNFQKHQMAFLANWADEWQQKHGAETDSTICLAILLKKLSRFVALFRTYLAGLPLPGSASKLPVPHGWTQGKHFAS